MWNVAAAAVLPPMPLWPPDTRSPAAQGAQRRGCGRPSCLRNPDVLQALRDELTRKLNAGAALGVQTLMDLCQNARSEQVKLSAANSLIDRGLGPVMSRNAIVHAHTTVDDIILSLDASEKATAARGEIGQRQVEEALVLDGDNVEG